MKAVIQRVNSGKVTIDRKITGAIGKGLLVYLGIGREDEEQDVDYFVNKISNLRIFEDEEGKMNLSALALKHEILVGGMPVVNTPILGSVPKVLDQVTLNSIQDVIRNKWKGRLSEINVEATKDAYELTEVNF